MHYMRTYTPYTGLYSDLRYLYWYEHARVLAYTCRYIIRLLVARESYCDISRWSCNTVGLLTNNTRLLDKSCCISYRGTIYITIIYHTAGIRAFAGSVLLQVYIPRYNNNFFFILPAVEIVIGIIRHRLSS